LNLDKLSKDLEKKYNDLLEDRSSIIHHYHYSANEAELERDRPLIDHLGDHHIVPENLTIEGEEWFRLLKKRDKALGYDPRLDPNYKF
jgi:hypothetical protein